MTQLPCRIDRQATLCSQFWEFNSLWGVSEYGFDGTSALERLFSATQVETLAWSCLSRLVRQPGWARKQKTEEKRKKENGKEMKEKMSSTSQDKLFLGKKIQDILRPRKSQAGTWEIEPKIWKVPGNTGGLATLVMFHMYEYRTWIIPIKGIHRHSRTSSFPRHGTNPLANLPAVSLPAVHCYVCIVWSLMVSIHGCQISSFCMTICEKYSFQAFWHKILENLKNDKTHYKSYSVQYLWQCQTHGDKPKMHKSSPCSQPGKNVHLNLGANRGPTNWHQPCIG